MSAPVGTARDEVTSAMKTQAGLSILEGIRREDDLLLCCSRTSLDSETVYRIRGLCRHPIDWKYLTEMASFHRVLPLLYRSLRKADVETVPPKVLEDLRSHSFANALTHSLLSEELVRLLTLFSKHGVPVVPIKGPALAASVYGDGALRQTGDLDILVRRQDIYKARELLLSHQYRTQLTDDEEKSRLQSHYHWDFARQDNRFFVELHWALTPRYWQLRLDLESMEACLGTVMLAGQAVPNLASHEMLLILCAHGTKHLWGRLRWVCDVAELLQRETRLEWGPLLARAKKIGCQRMLYLGLYLAKQLLQAPLPPEIWQEVCLDHVVPQLAGRVYKELFPSLKVVPDPANLQEFYLMARERIRDRIRYFDHDQLRGYRQAILSGINPMSSRRAAVKSSFARPFQLVATHSVRVPGLFLKYFLGR